MMSLANSFSKYVFIGSLTITSLGGAFLYGVKAQRENLPPIPTLRAISQMATAMAPLKSQTIHHLQPSRGAGDGVMRNTADGDGLVFMVGFFEGETQARLVDRDGSIKKSWSLDYLKHFPETEDRVCDYVTNRLGVDVHGALLTPAGELVFNYEYCGTVKLDSCGNTLWTLPDYTHHSLTRAEAGGYWILGRYIWSSQMEPDRFPPFSSAPYPSEIYEDTIMRVSEQGEVLQVISIPALMRDNGLLALLTATGGKFTKNTGGRAELVHANKVTELPAALGDAYPLFSAGDLAISMRKLNLVLVIDAETMAVKWHQVGPWLRQHDPEFRPDGRLSIFNNNVFRNAYNRGQTDLAVPFTTNIIAVDPVTSATEVIYGESPGQEMLSVIRGQHEVLPDDGMLITEFDAGRVIEVDAEGQIVWEYVNRYDDEFVGEITNALVYPETYFTDGPPDTATCQ